MIIQRVWYLACALGLAVAILSVPCRAEGAGLDIEFNKIEQIGAVCRLTFKSTNRLTVNLQGFGIEVYLLDGRGVALQSVQFTFGAIAAAKARFAKFDLKERHCGDIGGVFVNELNSCKSDTDITQQCQNNLTLKNLTAIKFTDGAF